ncbi:MAG: alpha/beta fold hydrolase [Solirubrobacterales bacterium]
MINSSRHWQGVAERLADSHRVIAPDLIGHGDSATPRGDYSLGAHAASIRDLLTTIGVERATIVGHSLGGGVAMQFFYQFPQRTERLGLVSSGGLGQEVSPLLRGAALPGSASLLRLASDRRLVASLAATGSRLRQRGVATGVYLQAVARALGPLQESGSRRAFLQTLRAVIDFHGQKMSARDRLYLLGEMPTLIAWGERDRTIPIGHGREASAAIPNCRFELLPRAAHFPNLEDPEALAAILRDWIATTEPHHIDDSEWGEVIAHRAARVPGAAYGPGARRGGGTRGWSGGSGDPLHSAVSSSRSWGSSRPQASPPQPQNVQRVTRPSLKAPRPPNPGSSRTKTRPRPLAQSLKGTKPSVSRRAPKGPRPPIAWFLTVAWRPLGTTLSAKPAFFHPVVPFGPRASTRNHGMPWRFQWCLRTRVHHRPFVPFELWSVGAGGGSCWGLGVGASDVGLPREGWGVPLNVLRLRGAGLRARSLKASPRRHGRVKRDTPPLPLAKPSSLGRRGTARTTPAPATTPRRWPVRLPPASGCPAASGFLPGPRRSSPGRS